jgi:hypothetical protein
MALEFLFSSIAMIAFGTILFLVARTLPRISEEDADLKHHSLFDRWFSSGIPDRIDAMLNTYIWKFFRRAKVVVMRLDNYLTERLKKMHPAGNGNGKPKIDFREIQENSTGEAVATKETSSAED